MVTTPDPKTYSQSDLREIAEALGGVAKDLQEVVGYGKRTRRLTWTVLIVVVVGLLLFTAAAVLIRNNQIEACHIGNDGRHGQIVIWHEIVKLQQSDPNRTARQEQETQQFLHFVDKTFHPLNCVGLYSFRP